MNTEIISKIATIVDTLLQVGERVVEVSEGYVISRIWDRKGSTIFQKEEVWAGKNLADLPKEYLAAKCAEKVTLAISTEENQYFECEAILDFSKQKFGIRILPIHPEKDKLFIVIELLQVNRSKNQPKGSSKQESPVLSEIRNEIEVRFEQQRLYYERILNNISADIAVLDADYRFLYVNPANVRDEETRKWLIGKTDEEFFIHRNKSLVIAERRKRMYEAARNERQVIEWIEKTGTLTGTIKTTLRRIYPVFDEKGNLDIIIGYSMNISELISAQEELKTTREIFESAFHDSGIGMALISAGGRWLDVNKVMCELTGYSKEELMRTSIRAIAYPGEWELDRELIKKMLLKEIPNFTVERRYISKQSKIVTVLLTLSVVWGTNEMPGFFIAQAIDVTVKKELEDVVTRKNSELEATKIKLLNKVNQLEELSYIIAHNLRGPAGNIKVLTEALLAKNNNENSEGKLGGAFTLEEGLGFIHEASTSLMSTLSSLMQIAEIKFNKDLPKSDCNIQMIIDDVSMQLQTSIIEKKAKINLSLEVLNIQYPKAYFESILYNFLSNALKYSKPGIPPEITIKTMMEGKNILLKVKDNGMGIDLDKYGDKIFKLNQVFHGGADSKGVGLYLTKTQVESFGGNISVVSRLNEGCEFVVTI